MIHWSITSWRFQTIKMFSINKILIKFSASHMKFHSSHLMLLPAHSENWIHKYQAWVTQALALKHSNQQSATSHHDMANRQIPKAQHLQTWWKLNCYRFDLMSGLANIILYKPTSILCEVRQNMLQMKYAQWKVWLCFRVLKTNWPKLQ